MLFRTLVAALGLPFGEGEALHSAENTLLEIGVAAAQLENQILYLGAFGGLVHGAAVFDDGQIVALDEIVHGPRLF